MKCKSNRTDQEIIDDFWKRVEVKTPEECWNWTGATFPRFPYGRMRVRGKYVRCHVFSLELQTGPLPPGTLVCHHCDNPRCCNPSHLYAGTHATNLNDAISRNRIKFQKGEQHYNAKLSSEDVAYIRSNYGRYGIEGIDGRALARKFGVNPNTISKIVLRKKWTSVV